MYNPVFLAAPIAQSATGSNGSGKGFMSAASRYNCRAWRDPSSRRDFTDGELFYISCKLGIQVDNPRLGDRLGFGEVALFRLHVGMTICVVAQRAAELLRGFCNRSEDPKEIQGPIRGVRALSGVRLYRMVFRCRGLAWEHRVFLRHYRRTFCSIS
jgi:hypothetical protein